MDQDFMNHPAMQDLSPQKKEILLELAENTKGKDMNAAVKAFSHTTEKMRKLGLTFTPEESKLISSILTEGLSPADKAKIEMARKMLQSKEKKNK